MFMVHEFEDQDLERHNDEHLKVFKCQNFFYAVTKNGLAQYKMKDKGINTEASNYQTFFYANKDDKHYKIKCMSIKSQFRESEDPNK